MFVYMNVLKEISFSGEKPGLNFGSIAFIFCSPINDENYLRMIVDWRDGQTIVIDKILGNVVIGRILTDDPKEYLSGQYALQGIQYLFS